MDPAGRNPVKFEVVDLKGSYESFHPEVVSSVIHHTANLVGNRVFLIAKLLRGRRNSETWNCCYLDTVRWEWVWLGLRGPRFYMHQAVLVDDFILVYGDDAAAGEGVGNLWKLDVAGMEWLRLDLQRLPMKPSFIACEFIESIRRVVCFGRGYDDEMDLLDRANSLLLIDVDKNTWLAPREKGARPSPRIGQASCVFATRAGSTVFFFGGRSGNDIGSGNFFNDLYMLQVQELVCSWSKVLLSLRVKPVSAASIVCVNDTIFILGGFDHNFDDVTTFVSYDISNNKWCDIRESSGRYKLEGALRATSAHCLVPYADGMLVVGGFGRTFPWVDIIRVIE